MGIEAVVEQQVPLAAHLLARPSEEEIVSQENVRPGGSQSKAGKHQK